MMSMLPLVGVGGGESVPLVFDIMRWSTTLLVYRNVTLVLGFSAKHPGAMNAEIRACVYITCSSTPASGHAASAYDLSSSPPPQSDALLKPSINCRVSKQCSFTVTSTSGH